MRLLIIIKTIELFLGNEAIADSYDCAIPQISTATKQENKTGKGEYLSSTPKNAETWGKLLKEIRLKSEESGNKFNTKLRRIEMSVTASLWLVLCHFAKNPRRMNQIIEWTLTKTVQIKIGGSLHTRKTCSNHSNGLKFIDSLLNLEIYDPECELCTYFLLF